MSLINFLADSLVDIFKLRQLTKRSYMRKFESTLLTIAVRYAAALKEKAPKKLF